MKRIFWTPEAIGGLATLRAYYARLGVEETAQRYGAALLEAAAALPPMPHRGRAGRVPGTRELLIPHLPYLLIYRITDEQIEILVVLHHAQEWPR